MRPYSDLDLDGQSGDLLEHVVVGGDAIHLQSQPLTDDSPDLLHRHTRDVLASPETVNPVHHPLVHLKVVSHPRATTSLLHQRVDAGQFHRLGGSDQRPLVLVVELGAVGAPTGVAMPTR